MLWSCTYEWFPSSFSLLTKTSCARSVFRDTKCCWRSCASIPGPITPTARVSRARMCFTFSYNYALFFFPFHNCKRCVRMYLCVNIMSSFIPFLCAVWFSYSVISTRMQKGVHELYLCVYVHANCVDWCVGGACRAFVFVYCSCRDWSSLSPWLFYHWLPCACVLCVVVVFIVLTLACFCTHTATSKFAK